MIFALRTRPQTPRGDTGEPIFAGGGPDEAMVGRHHLQTLLAADGRLYVRADGRIYAFTY